MTNEEIAYVEMLKELIDAQKRAIEIQKKIIAKDALIKESLKELIELHKHVIVRLVYGGFQSEEDKKKLLELFK